MNINATLVGQVYFVVAVVVIFFTLKFAKGKSNNFPLTCFYTFVLNLLFPPGAWLYCLYWGIRKV